VEPPRRQHRWQAILTRHPDRIAAALVAAGFLWRVWLAHATFFNADEAWHFSVANQNSLLQAYKMSHTLAHPPLLVLILYFWRHVGTSNLMLRLPSVIAGALFCWVFYKWLSGILGRAAGWAGLLFVTFLPPMIALSADLRQYTLMLLFSVSGAYLLERALAQDSAPLMLLSSGCLYLAMLSHYSAFLFAAALGAYCILRFLTQRVSAQVVAAWLAGQAGGLGLAWFLYSTHIAGLQAAYPQGQPLHRFGDFYIREWYFHPGHDHLLPFLYHGTFGVFRFVFGNLHMGDVATVMFVAGVVILLLAEKAEAKPYSPRVLGIYLLLPFAVNWAVVWAGLYPYGRTRHCVFLAVFGIAGVSVLLARIAKQRTAIAAALAIGIVILCHIFGTLQGRDMLPLADQRHEHMDQAVEFLGREVASEDLIFADKVTSMQLGHYLCRQKVFSVDHPVAGYEEFRCNGFRVVSTELTDGPMIPDTFASEFRDMVRRYRLKPEDRVWVVQAGWARGLGEILRSRFPQFAGIEPHAFGHFIDAFRLTVEQPVPSAVQER